jgi:hypothetical protein
LLLALGPTHHTNATIDRWYAGVVVCCFVGPMSSVAVAVAAKFRVTDFERTQDCALGVSIEGGASRRVAFQIKSSNPYQAVLGIDGADVIVKRVSYRGSGTTVKFTFSNLIYTVKFFGQGGDNDEDGAFYDGTLTVSSKGSKVVNAGFLRSCI